MPENPYKSPEAGGKRPERAKRDQLGMFLGFVLVVLGSPFLLMPLVGVLLVVVGRKPIDGEVIAPVFLSLVVGLFSVGYGLLLVNRRIKPRPSADDLSDR